MTRWALFSVPDCVSLQAYRDLSQLSMEHVATIAQLISPLKSESMFGGSVPRIAYTCFQVFRILPR